MKHVQKCRKTGNLQYRRRIPKEFQEAAGKKEFLRSLCTKDPVEAAERYAATQAAYNQTLREAAGTASNRQNFQQAVEWAISNGIDLTRTYKEQEADEGPVEPYEPYGSIGFVNRDIAIDLLTDTDSRGRTVAATPDERWKLELLIYGNKAQRPAPSVDEALEIYLKEKGRLERRSETGAQFKRYLQADRRAIQTLTDLLPRMGATLITDVTREQARQWRDMVVAKYTKETIRKHRSTLRDMFATVLAVEGINAANPFDDLKVPMNATAIHTDPKEAWTVEEEELILSNIHRLNDHAELAVRLMACTGSRLVDVLFLQADEIVLDAAIPHIWIKANPLRGATKKGFQQHKVPIVDPVALRLLEAIRDGCTRYHNDRGNTSASNLINKFYRTQLGLVDKRKSNHSFRHALVTKLRNVGCPGETVEKIVGHAGKTVQTRVYWGDADLAEQARWLRKALRLPEEAAQEPPSPQ
tara:strand:- start:111 stop:1520 length:1410 start_codon:yes stop_codon:yes gene_type:complete